MAKYLFSFIAVWCMISCAESEPIEPPIDPPGPGNPTTTITTPELVFVSLGKAGIHTFQVF